MVSDQERFCLESVVDKPRGAQRQRQALLTRALCRRTLSALRPNMDPGDWLLGYHPSGAPHVQHSAFQGQETLAFSLSHTQGMVVCAACTNAELGVDVERMMRPARAERIAERLFAAQEYQRLMAHRQGDARNEAFLLLWTLKEAYLKLLGEGLTALTPSMAFEFDAEGEVFGLMPEARTPNLWTLSRVVAGSHRLAIVVRTPTGASPAWSWRYGWTALVQANNSAEVFVQQGVRQTET